MSQSNVEVPPAVPVAAPATATVAAPPAPVAAQPAAPASTAAAPAIIPAAPAPVIKTEPAVGDPAWLAPRLESAKLAALRAAGFESEAEAKAAADAIKAQKESEKSMAEKLASRDAELTATKTRAQQLEASTKEYAARMMVGLTEAQKNAVTAVAGEDAAAQLRAVIALTPTWAKEAEAAAPVAPAAAQAPAAPPANTAPGRTAPAGIETSPTNHNSVYETLKQSNPFEAARYAAQHPEAYTKATA